MVWEREGPVRLPPRPHISGAQLRKLRVTKPVQERGALAAALALALALAATALAAADGDGRAHADCQRQRQRLH